MQFDDKYRLIQSILGLANCDLNGVLFHIYNDAASIVYENRYENQLYKQTLPYEEIMMDCLVRFDELSEHTLLKLQSYVNDCYTLDEEDMDVCDICVGLWDNGKLVHCGNDYCETKVHEGCFGITLREHGPSGPWYCPSCASGKDIVCALCLQVNGALKRSTDDQYVHVICGLVVPETSFKDVPTLEPVEGIARIPISRMRLLCGLCKLRGGVCIECEDSHCHGAFHPKCAADAGYLIGNEVNPMALFCDKHLPHDRIPNAKRWISKEDCIRSDRSSLYSKKDLDDYDFIRESTLFHVEKDIDAQTELHFHVAKQPIGRSCFPRTFTSLHNSHQEAPKSNSTSETSKNTKSFPSGRELVNAICDVKLKDSIYRIQVCEWSSRFDKNYISFLQHPEKNSIWLKLTTQNTSLLCMSNSTKVKLLRNRSGQWQCKPVF